MRSRAIACCLLPVAFLYCLLPIAHCLGGSPPVTMQCTVDLPTAVAPAPAPPEIHRDGSLYGADPVRLLYALLILDESSRLQDQAIVEQLRDLRGFTHVALVTLSWQDRPLAVYDPLVREAAATLQSQGIHVVWGRWLWVAWSDGLAPGVQVPPPLAQFHAAFYAEAIEHLRREAEALGATATLLDVETYGRCAQKALQKLELTEGDRAVIGGAVDAAVRRVGAVDVVLPTSSSRATHYAWPLGKLGLLRADNKTYYTPRGDGRVVANPPAGFVQRLDLWGSNVGLGRSVDVAGTFAKLTVDQAKAIDLETIRERWPECRGFWVYADHDILADVLRQWKEASP
ncbi:MAG: hypothetical protein J5J06_05450 [Phycisphaerae bacterium]|nr:hypothetical protein [Phycisphaerae bacterium]